MPFNTGARTPRVNKKKKKKKMVGQVQLSYESIFDIKFSYFLF